MKSTISSILIMVTIVFTTISFEKTARAEQEEVVQVVISHFSAHAKHEYYVNNHLLAINIRGFATKTSPVEDRLMIFPRNKSGGYVITTVDYRGVMTKFSINGHVSLCNDSSNQKMCNQMLHITYAWRNKLRVKGTLQGIGRKTIIDLRQFTP
ncbi:MAG: hypothetical protein HQ536_04330 [Parcubacteria group bacterium]|nr:hypothetical protein [Parcubacteria group bacterium]